jgi:anaerobic magnesium-protoporphyrin IX monomethyl ester cyclase
MKRKKIILYNPSAVFYTMPLALVAVGSYLDKNEYDVIIIDSRLEKDPIKKLLSEAKDALCVGVTVLTGDPIRDALKASRTVKSVYPHLPVVWGGWHTSLFPKDTLREPSIDITVQGQGEVTFSELAARLTCNEDLSGLQGITYRTKNEIIQNPPRALKDMNEFPLFDYGLLDVESYYKLKKQKQFDYISSTGCYFRCAFCADPYVYNRKWSALSPERMGEEIEALWHKYKFEELSFQDETFFTYKERVISIAEEFIKRGLKFKWNATMRADQGSRMSDDVFGLLVKSGLRWVLIGVESGSNEMLKWLKKDITVEQILFCARLCKRFGIHVNFPSIVGFPGETDESVSSTLNLIKELRQMSPKFETPIFYYKPYPGSSITAEVLKSGFELPATIEEWADFDYIGSSGPWVGKEKYKLIERFKFYNRLAGGPETFPRKSIQKIARWRLKRDFFAIPLEKMLIEKLRPAARLS